MQHGMIWVGQDQLGSIYTKDGLGINESGSWIGLMATSNPDKSKLIYEGDKKTAIIFGERIANIANRLATRSGVL
jgi:NAD(P)H dehydrogenase (quinone)